MPLREGTKPSYRSYNPKTMSAISTLPPFEDNSAQFDFTETLSLFLFGFVFKEQSSEVWEDTECLIDHLVTRTGVKKGGTPRKAAGISAGTGKGTARKGKAKARWSGDESGFETENDSELDLSDHESDDITD